MPCYDYSCRNCGYKFSAIQSLGARDLATCPRCFCIADKVFSRFNFTFGFTLSDESRWVPHHKDEFVRNI